MVAVCNQAVDDYCEVCAQQEEGVGVVDIRGYSTSCAHITSLSA